MFTPPTTLTTFSVVSPMDDSRNTAPILRFVSLYMPYNRLVTKVVLPTDVKAPITVTSPAPMPPFIILLSVPNEEGKGIISALPRFTNASQQLSSDSEMTPAGLYSSAPHHAFTNCCTLPRCSISPASLSGRDTTLALPGEKMDITSRDAFFPAASLSKQMTTFSNVSSHSRLSLMSFDAAAAPRFRLTTGYLPSNISATAIASNSPSVTVTNLPPLLQTFCPNRPVPSIVPVV